MLFSSLEINQYSTYFYLSGTLVRLKDMSLVFVIFLVESARYVIILFYVQYIFFLEREAVLLDYLIN